MDYLRTSDLDSSGIRDLYPKNSKYADLNPDGPRLKGKFISAYERLDTREKRRIAAVYTQSLMSLNLILGYFKDNTKVVYLFSCGIPTSAMEWKTEYESEAANPAGNPPDVPGKHDPGFVQYRRPQEDREGLQPERFPALPH